MSNVLIKPTEIDLDRELTPDDIVYQYIINFKSGGVIGVWLLTLDIDSGINSMSYTLPLIKPEAPKVLMIPQKINVSQVESVWIAKEMNAIQFYNDSDRV